VTLAVRQHLDRFARAVWAHRADVVGAAIPIVALLIAFSPVLFGGRTLSTASYSVGSNGFGPFPGQRTVDEPRHYQLDTGASAWQFEPWAEATSRIISDGELPLWNPYTSAGAPLAANMQSAPFDPLFAFVNLHPTTWTWDMTLIGCFTLAALATYVFARVLGLGSLGAVTASSAYGLAGYFFLYSNNHFSVGYVYLPILLALCEWVVRSARLLAVFCLALATAACIAVGMPEIQILVLLTAVGYGIWRSFFGVRAARSLPTLGWLAGGFALGGLMAAPLLLPFREFEAQSFNVHKPTDDVGELTDPFQYLLAWVFPFIDGYPLVSTSAGIPSGTREWIGGAVAMLAVVGTATKRAVRVVLPFFAAIVVLVFAKVYGVPGIQWVGRLPLLELVNFPRYVLPVAGMALAMLAGIGVDAIRRRAVNVPRLIIVGTLATVVLAVATYHYRDTLRNVPHSQIYGQVAIGTIGGLVVIGALLVPWKRPAAYVAALAVIAELLILVPNADAYPLRADPYHEPVWMTAMRPDLSAHPYERIFGLDALVFPGTAAAFGLYDIRALDALYVDRYWTYVHTFIEPQAFSRFIGGPYGVPEETTPAHYEDNPMFDLLGVRYLMARNPLAGSPSPTAGTEQWRLLESTDGVQVYENQHPAPRAFVASAVDVVPDANGAVAWFESRSSRLEDGALDVTGVDPTTTAVIEADRDELPSGVGATSSCPTPAETTITSYQADQVKLTVDASCPGLLVLSDTYYPGWSATVNGSSVAVHPTDIALRGVFVDAGHSEVVFSYRPSSFRSGVVLSALAFALLPLVALVRWFVRSRRRRRLT